MLFTASVKAPANTPKESPVVKPVRLKEGILTKVSILIPSGHAALAHLAIKDGETQIIPWGDDEWIEGDNETLEWEPNYRLPSEPAELSLVAWNEDQLYDHTFYVRFWITPFEEYTEPSLARRATEKLEALLSRIIGV
jgi:hypothetical protein